MTLKLGEVTMKWLVNNGYATDCIVCNKRLNGEPGSVFHIPLPWGLLTIGSCRDHDKWTALAAAESALRSLRFVDDEHTN